MPSKRRIACSGVTRRTSRANCSAGMRASSIDWCGGLPRCTARCWRTTRRPSCCWRRSWPTSRASPWHAADREEPRRLALDMAAACFHLMPDGRRIAFRHAPGQGPAVAFLPGYMSDMSGSKATALFDWAMQNGRECLLLDYSGCGESDGDFADGTLSRWTEEVLALVAARIAGPVVLVGSSMGGWLMLLAALALGPRVAGLVGIAPAPDFTQWA